MMVLRGAVQPQGNKKMRRGGTPGSNTAAKQMEASIGQRGGKARAGADEGNMTGRRGHTESGMESNMFQLQRFLFCSKKELELKTLGGTFCTPLGFLHHSNDAEHAISSPGSDSSKAYT